MIIPDDTWYLFVIIPDIYFKERKFLLAVERGDVASTRYIYQDQVFWLIPGILTDTRYFDRYQVFFTVPGIFYDTRYSLQVPDIFYW